jgi:hypothetical protein
MPQRVTQTNVEIASEATSPSARVTQANIEISSEATAPQARVTQANVEISSESTQPEARVTQVSASVLLWVRSVHLWSDDTFGGWSFFSGGTVGLAPPPAPPISILTPFSGGRLGGYKPKPNEADRLLERLTRVAIQWAKKVQPEQFLPPGAGRRGLGSNQEPLWHHSARIRTRRPFLVQKAIVTPHPSSGDVDIIRLEAPEGFFGVITGYGWEYTGTGYVQGSTDIYWRLKVGLWFPQGLGQVRFMLGDPRDPLKTGAMIMLRPRQVVRLIVRVNNDSGNIQVGGSYILGALCGWFYEPYKEFAP